MIYFHVHPPDISPRHFGVWLNIFMAFLKHSLRNQETTVPFVISMPSLVVVIFVAIRM